MPIETILTIILVPGIVWGGFIILMRKATRHEKMKKANGKK